MVVASAVRGDASAATSGLAKAAPVIDSGGTPQFVVVGIGADGWPGLSQRARDELCSAEVIFGARRQLDLLRPVPGKTVPDDTVRAETVPWESPMSEHLARVLDDPGHRQIHILASGDPMFHGVGTTVVNAVGAARTRIIPAVSSVSLACARLGWDLTGVGIVSLVTDDESAVLAEASHGRRLLVLSRDQHSPGAVIGVLGAAGFGESTITVLEQLGGPREKVVSGVAGTWSHPPGDRLNIVAVDCVGPYRTRAPGRADADYLHDGQITKSAHRALSICALEPAGGQTLWDIGAGSGSISVEWLRAAGRGHAVAFERDPHRAERIRENARQHGVASAITVLGGAPEALATAPRPDAVFIGGGLTETVLAAAFEALRPGGPLVVNAVTVESQALVLGWHRRHGGTTRRVMIESVEPLGSMNTWRPALPIVQWILHKHVDGGAQ